MEKLESLPLEIQEQVKDTLGAYNEVHVIFSDGEYHASTGIMLLGHYPSDHRFVGSYKVDDVFNEDEKILNYVRNFRDYPIKYKGERDYNLLREMRDGGWDENEVKIKLVDGNIVKA